MGKKSGFNRSKVALYLKADRKLGFYCRGLLVGLVLFFTAGATQASLFELMLDPEGLQKLGAYNDYAWSRSVSWEVSQSVLAPLAYYNEVFTFDTSPNLIGMHLLDVEENNSYRYNLGIVVTATFDTAENVQSQTGSGGSTDSTRSGLELGGTHRVCDMGFNSYIPPSKSNTPPKSVPNTPSLVPEPIVLGLLIPGLFLAMRKRLRV